MGATMDDDRPGLSTRQKALKINLDPIRYGTLAEIGAGQEVARWFFMVGGAAGSISAGETATPITYTHCRSGAEVALWRFAGSGHVWPGSSLNMGPKKNWILAGVGRGIVLVNADETMWQFFEKYSLPSNPR